MTDFLIQVAAIVFCMVSTITGACQVLILHSTSRNKLKEELPGSNSIDSVSFLRHILILFMAIPY